MTSLLHTADVHLRPDADDRLDALAQVLDLATEQNVDVVTIGGDLFDRPADVEELRNDLRNRFFTEHSFDIVLIPGNHDVEAFRGDLFFGDACTVIADADSYGTWVDPTADLRIVGIPYRERVTDELLLALQDRAAFDGTDVLLFHGSLDAPISADAGDEDAHRYFPVTEHVLTELDFDYYLAGHYHGSHHLQFDDGGAFAYPGTPASTRSSETGQRRVVHLDPDGGLTFEPLDTIHSLDKRVTVTPGAEDEALADIEAWIESTVTPNSDPTIHVDGVIDRSEADFAEQVHDLAEPEWIQSDWISAETITSHPVLQEFETRVNEQDWDDDLQEAVWTRTLRVASQVSNGGFT